MTGRSRFVVRFGDNATGLVRASRGFQLHPALVLDEHVVTQHSRVTDNDRVHLVHTKGFHTHIPNVAQVEFAGNAVVQKRTVFHLDGFPVRNAKRHLGELVVAESVHANNHNASQFDIVELVLCEGVVAHLLCRDNKVAFKFVPLESASTHRAELHAFLKPEFLNTLFTKRRVRYPDNRLSIQSFRDHQLPVVRFLASRETDKDDPVSGVGGSNSEHGSFYVIRGSRWCYTSLHLYRFVARTRYGLSVW